MSVRPSAIPQCSACLRQWAFGSSSRSGTVTAGPLAQQQVRGKKKMVNNSATVTVRLNKDMSEYGRKGAVIPVSRGRMRNIWHPQRIANYVTQPELKQLRLSGATIERDFGFQVARPAKAIAKEQLDIDEAPMIFQQQAEPTITRLSPARSVELLTMLVPKRLDFFRQAIVSEDVKETVFDNTGDDLFAAAPVVQRAQPIYGSVSTQDVLSTVRALLAENDEASRLSLDADELFFVDKINRASEIDKVKHTGDYEVIFRLKGAEETVSKVVRVLSQTTTEDA